MPLPYAEAQSTNLNQGDVLRRTPALENVLELYHRHFHDHAKNKYFMVLTQSCDLEMRDDGTCKSRYITLAAVRSLSTAFSRELSQLNQADFGLPFSVGTIRTRQKLQDFLTRLANNNEPRYFFLRNFPERGLPEDCCAILALSVPIKADDHYKTCVDAKLLELDAVFQAKLGWLVGQTYSRVGTQDMTNDEVSAIIKRILPKAAVWIDDKQIAETQSRVAQWRAQNPDAVLSETELTKIIKSIPERRERVLERLGKLLAESATLKKLTQDGHIDDEKIGRIMMGFRADAILRSLLKG